jgi:hypothetical protein
LKEHYLVISLFDQGAIVYRASAWAKNEDGTKTADFKFPDGRIENFSLDDVELIEENTR